MSVLDEVRDEMDRQLDTWGEQNHPLGFGGATAVTLRDNAQALCTTAARFGTVTWRHILAEEVYEAFAEEDIANARVELIQVAAVAAQMVCAIDRKKGTE